MTPFLTKLAEVFSEPEWLIPMAASVVLQIAAPHRFKHLLPSGKLVPAFSIALGLVSFVALRAAMLVKGGGAWSFADLVIDLTVALVVVCLVPWIYSKLPQSFQDKYSYSTQIEKRKKIIRTRRGLKPVDEDYETDHEAGETTVIPAGSDETMFVNIGEPTGPRDEAASETTEPLAKTEPKDGT